MNDRIPVYSQSGRLLQRLTLANIEALHLPEVLLVRSRKGYLKRVRLKGENHLVRPVLNGTGLSFTQQLDNGLHCWAFTGVPGS